MAKPKVLIVDDETDVVEFITRTLQSEGYDVVCACDGIGALDLADEVCGMPDEMFFLSDQKSLRRGRRIAVRTEICRPCVIWPADEPEKRYNGVALDVSPHGMRVRMMDPLAVGQAIYVQMMRDEDFSAPLTDPMATRVVRSEPEVEGFLDHGVQIIRQKLHREEQRRVPAMRTAPAPTRTPRMYTLDIVAGERERAGRKRG